MQTVFPDCCRSKKEVRVSFTCSIDGVSLTTRDEVCQVTVTKKKEYISGEHILPLCRIQMNKLKLLADYLHNSINRYNEWVVPRVSDQKLHRFIIEQPEKSMNVIGEDILVYLRVLLWSIVRCDSRVRISHDNVTYYLYYLSTNRPCNISCLVICTAALSATTIPHCLRLIQCYYVFC